MCTHHECGRVLYLCLACMCDLMPLHILAGMLRALNQVGQPANHRPLPILAQVPKFQDYANTKTLCMPQLQRVRQMALMEEKMAELKANASAGCPPEVFQAARVILQGGVNLLSK
ncbi:unnamed protein product [Prorocentrum cordatum]|uniref:Uncharacterized protein n=1 Tax=Prorocentrum cordatum TaxID=2364126 RepID=A0ABN9TX99_9DINO|nr:unnamed protein product [Polarella glacialis]